MSSLSLPPPKRSKQTTLLEIFRGASSHESDADNEDEPDADRLSEPKDDRTTTNDAESPSSQSPPSALVPALEVGRTDQIDIMNVATLFTQANERRIIFYGKM